jgi:hypothetical protein
MVHFELEVVDRDSSVRINGSVHSEAEDILYRLIRGVDREFSEERLFFLEGRLESPIGDFLSGGVDLLVVISVEFKIKDPLGVLDLFDVFSDTGADESVLEPTIGAFDFASGLWREGVNDLNVTILKDLFPLRGGLISHQMVFIPERISSPDISEDRVRINIVGIRKPVLEDDGLEGQDVGPAGLCFEQNGIEHETAVIIERSDEVPFLLRGRGPEVVGGIMLDKFSDITG